MVKVNRCDFSVENLLGGAPNENGGGQGRVGGDGGIPLPIPENNRFLPHSIYLFGKF